jgi:hypothetical protein
VSTTPAIPVSSAQSGIQPAAHFLADIYSSQWSALNFRLSAISASAVALCLLLGVALGRPGGALIAGGGALTIGFGINQRIGDCRLLPMLLGVFAIGSATLAGTLVGHSDYAIVLASLGSAGIYGVLTVRNAGLAWVGQQASVALFVASAFPSSPKAALVRSGLIVLGGMVQILITSVGLRLVPELREDIGAIRRSLYHSLSDKRLDLLRRVRELPNAVPVPQRRPALIYAFRLMLTVGIATEVYRRLGLQSGYWTPMTALLVQKPAFRETLTRGTLRIAGTLAGATLATVLVAHVPLGPWTLAAFTAFFAFWSFAMNPVNYGLFALCLTSYIVFLLSLNQIPGPEIAHRRALCTVEGAAIAMVIHVDALRRHRADLSKC